MEMHLLYVRCCSGSLAERRHLPYSKLVFDISLKLLLSEHRTLTERTQRDACSQATPWKMFDLHWSLDTVFSVTSVSFFSLFLGKNSGVKKEVCKGGGTVSKILVTVQLLKPDVKRRSLTLSLNCSVNDFAWWWLLSISVSLSIHWQFLSMWGWALQEVGNVTLHFGLESVLVITSFY